MYSCQYAPSSVSQQAQIKNTYRIYLTTAVMKLRLSLKHPLSLSLSLSLTFPLNQHQPLDEIFHIKLPDTMLTVTVNMKHTDWQDIGQNVSLLGVVIGGALWALFMRILMFSIADSGQPDQLYSGHSITDFFFTTRSVFYAC